MIGEMIKGLRTSRALSLQDIADRSGLTTVAICRIEQGQARPRPSTLRKLADALMVDVDQLTRELEHGTPAESEDAVSPVAALNALDTEAASLATLRAREPLQHIAEDVLLGLVSQDPGILDRLAELADSAARLDGPLHDLGWALARFLQAIRQEICHPEPAADASGCTAATRDLMAAVRDPASDWETLFLQACRRYAGVLLEKEPSVFRQVVGSFRLHRARLTMDDLNSDREDEDAGDRPSGRRAVSALASVLSLFDLANGARQAAGLTSADAGSRLRTPLLAGV